MAADKYDVVALARYVNSDPDRKPPPNSFGDENAISSAVSRGWDENTLHYVWDSSDPHWW